MFFSEFLHALHEHMHVPCNSTQKPSRNAGQNVHSTLQRSQTQTLCLLPLLLYFFFFFSKEKMTTTVADPSVRFLTAWFCPYAQRACIALKEKNVTYEAIESLKLKTDGTTGYDKHELLLQNNPAGVVPVILTQDSKGKPAVVRESLICVEFVDEAYGEPNQLLPKDPVQRAQARLVADFINNNICSPFYGVLMKKTEEEREQAKQKLLDGLKKFSSEIQGPFYFGEQFSSVDIAIAPWIGRLVILETYRGFKLPETAEYANLRAWWDKVKARPSLRESLPEEKDLLSFAKRYIQE